MTEVRDPDGAARSTEQDLLAHSRTFVVRIRRGDSGIVTGVVEAVRTGERRPFEGTRAIGPVIDAMLTRPDRTAPGG
ncbi:MAG: hypothetical protein L0027_03460, partial [Candidatus Rokubacteria bacterium]|nr:hypothetical protein [Candidatus Rokubacteria bacterium]